MGGVNKRGSFRGYLLSLTWSLSPLRFSVLAVVDYLHEGATLGYLTDLC